MEDERKEKARKEEARAAREAQNMDWMRTAVMGGGGGRRRSEPSGGGEEGGKSRRVVRRGRCTKGSAHLPEDLDVNGLIRVLQNSSKENTKDLHAKPWRLWKELLSQ